MKTLWWKDACNHYERQIRHWRHLENVEIKDAEAGLDARARMAREGERILARLGDEANATALSESGEVLTSRQFAELMRQYDAGAAKKITFIIGGPFGLDERVLAKCPQKLSLSPMTWTHEMARVLLLEQIYRAENILRGTGYHH